MADARNRSARSRRRQQLHGGSSTSNQASQESNQPYTGVNSPARARRRAKMSRLSTDSTANELSQPKNSDQKSFPVPYLTETTVKDKPQAKRDKIDPSDHETINEETNGVSKSDVDDSDDYLRGSVYMSEGGSITKSYGSITKSKLSRSTVFSGITGIMSRSSGEERFLYSSSAETNARALSGFNTSWKLMASIKVLATLLPDEILNDMTKNIRNYETAVLFPDVSGYTDLCERYDKTGKGGPSRLTEVLNGFIGSMIQIVLSRNGDVCKFSGDALLCFWKTTPELNLMQIIHLAIDSAVDIQKNCGRFKTDVGVELKVKIAISAGETLFSIIGTDQRKYYIILGQPILDANFAEKLCEPGDIIVSPSAWKNVGNYLLYTYMQMSDKEHVKVLGFGPLWNSVKPSVKADTSGNVRVTVKTTANLKIEDIRPFILPAVMKGVENNEPLDYLTEMRQVAIIFINLTIDLRITTFEDLISHCDKAYQIVCKTVDKMDGTVNKLTLFDKDVAILIIFGLRGFRHELASQIALKCAYSCVQQLKSLQIFKSVSAGVTTGGRIRMTYCGVVGHQSRREYTVMGHAVNHAARLMCSYENIVSCDRETFLHSKLESAHFELLQLKQLKGIINAGPHYEFTLSLKREKITIDSSTFPLLGRAKEISEFEEFLGKAQLKRSAHKFMVIYGNARIGKTRLLAKLINIAEKQNVPSPDEAKESHSDHLEISFIPLTEDDYRSAYTAIRLIFEPALGLSETSSVEERQDKILSKLGDVKDISYLAALNPVFNVNFDLLPQFLAMNNEEQLNAQRMMKKRLYMKCFPRHRRWLIVIDDAEFIDEESWPLLRWSSAFPQSVLFLLTIGQRKPLSQAAAECLNSMHQKKIILNELEKWYQAGLACQILGVKAIPVELENLIQGFKNSGNPGWLESYLLSLVQSGGLHVAYLTRHEIKNLKLVTPPDDMLSIGKLTEEEKIENSTWTNTVGTFEEDSRSHTSASQILPVCILGPKFVAEEICGESELTMDMMYVKTMDTLKPLEQLILKAGSALGYTFKRDTLKFVIFRDAPVDEKALGRAIKKLFEIRILGCAKGDFTSPTTVIVPRRLILSTNLQKDVKCECIGLTKITECQNLPLHASCGYLRFRSPVFKDTVYNLLLDDQKKKFHSSCIEYFRTNTYMCKSCGSKLFEKILGYDSPNQLTLVCAVSPMHGIRSTRMDKKNFPIPNYICDGIRRRGGSGERRRSFALGNYTQYISDINSFTNIDLSNCQCFQILSSVYSVISDHAEGAGRKDILLEVKLEYAAVSLTSCNIPLTMQLVEHALALVNQMEQDSEHPELCTPFVYGKIYTLMGATQLSMGRPANSLELLETALKYMGKMFPKSVAQMRWQIIQLYLKRKIVMDLFPQKFVGSVGGKKAALFDLMSECLGLTCHVYMITQNWLSAKLSAMWALNKALASNRHFYGLCTAYTNMMHVAYHHKDLETCGRMEVCAVNLCLKCARRPMEVYELDAIGHLYKVIFQSRHLRAEIESAVSIGFKSIKIATTIRNTSLRLDLMPDLIFALIQLNRLSEAVSLLQELEFTSMQDSDKSARTWYYALCLDFQLDTGYTVISYKNCEDFVREEEESLIVVRDPEAERRLYTSLWLWCIRNDAWEASKPYGKILKNLQTRQQPDSPSSVYTNIKRLEGMLISLVNKLENRNIHTISAIYTGINSLMKELEKVTGLVKLLKPRFLLLKAYYRQIRYHDESSVKILNRAKALADKINDKNTSDWINHNRMVWNSTISPIQRDYWKEHCRYDNLMDWHEASLNVRREAVMFSLPLPKYS